MEEYRNVYRQGGAAALAAYHSPNIDSILGLYYYPLIIPPYRTQKYNYLPTWKDVLYEQDLDYTLRNYEDKLWWINFREKMKLESEVQRLIDDLKREMERAKED